ncbi:MAG: hypothetical protein PHF46_02665, partial [Candidatus Gracilibacteria bacterium]|nr:hypothetical protein [Candidatus Gracilibacteria bacterium]
MDNYSVFYTIVIILATSLVSSFFVIKAFSVLFKKIGIMDNPKKYGYSREPVPYSMGIVFFVNFLILSLVFVKLGLMEYSSKLL